MRVAAIDIGTVTSRLLVADVDASGTRQVARQSAITNLGEGVDASGELLPEAIDRTVAQVAEYRKVIDACAPIARSIAWSLLPRARVAMRAIREYSCRVCVKSALNCR